MLLLNTATNSVNKTLIQCWLQRKKIGVKKKEKNVVERIEQNILGKGQCSKYPNEYNRHS